MAWIPKFGRLFEDLVRQAENTNGITIGRRVGSDGREMLTVRIETAKRTQEFIVDPETTLPVRFTTVRDDAPHEMVRRPLAIKHLTDIRYNETPPAGIFAKSTEAVVVKHEVDCLVDPNSGLVTDGMNQPEACRELVQQSCQAMIDLDTPKLKSLALFFRTWPEPVWEKAGKWIESYEITGDPFLEGDVWYVSTQVRSADGQTEAQAVMIKFYEFDGTIRAVCIGSKAKGMVD